MRPENNKRPNYGRRNYIDRGRSLGGSSPSSPRRNIITPPTDYSSSRVARPTNDKPEISDLNKESFTVEELRQILNTMEGRKFKLPKIKGKIKLPKIKINFKSFTEGLLTICIVSGILLGVVALIYRQVQYNRPDRTFADGILNGLQVKHIEMNVKSKSENSLIGFDFTNTKYPIIYSKQSLMTYGLPIDSEGYGDTKNSYFRYTKIPNTVQSELSTALLNAGVKIRENGSLPVNVPGSILRGTDPIYRIIGPYLVSNLDETNSKKIADYMVKRKAYQYTDKDVVSQKYKGKNVLVFKTKINVDELKQANQSVLVTMGYYPFEADAVIKSLEPLRGAKMNFYVGRGDHRVVATELITKNDTILYTYDKYNKATTPIEPQTKLSWVNYADAHYKMQAELAATRPLNEFDEYRKEQLNSLKFYLDQYNAQANSYPSFENLNSISWVRANLVGMDIDLLRDPLSTSFEISTTPRQNYVAYSTTGENAPRACDNTPINSCIHYRLTAILSNREQYSQTDLDKLSN